MIIYSSAKKAVIRMKNIPNEKLIITKLNTKYKGCHALVSQKDYKATKNGKTFAYLGKPEKIHKTGNNRITIVDFDSETALIV